MDARAGDGAAHCSDALPRIRSELPGTRGIVGRRLLQARCLCGHSLVAVRQAPGRHHSGAKRAALARGHRPRRSDQEQGPGLLHERRRVERAVGQQRSLDLQRCGHEGNTPRPEGLRPVCGRRCGSRAGACSDPAELDVRHQSRRRAHAGAEPRTAGCVARWERLGSCPALRLRRTASRPFSRRT